MGQGSITRKASDIRPLLLDRFRNAAAAYSLRPLTLSGQDNPVVKVRRSVDNTEQDFNPAQINDGTLEQFVNAGDVAPADYGTGAAAAYSLRHVSDGYTGDVVRVRRSVDNAEADFTATEVSDGTLATWVGAGNDGFVTTWYDQSGNSNDATQATAASQPKIVSGGSLVTENGKPAIDFDGVDDRLLNSTLTANSTQSVFYVKRGIIRSGNSNILGFPTTTNDTQIGIYYWNGVDYEYGFNTWNGDSWGIENATSLFTKQTIEFALFKDGNPTTSGVKLFIDSVEQSLSQVRATSTSRTMADGFRIGTGGASFANQDYDGLLQEIIIYSDDQSSNRELIETNVNHYYSIYSQTNDGFVTTWYDQSGNGNHATQATAAAQPKIVSAGSLVVENGKAAVKFFDSSSTASTPNLEFSNWHSADSSNVWGFAVYALNSVGFYPYILGSYDSGDRGVFINHFGNDRNIRGGTIRSVGSFANGDAIALNQIYLRSFSANRVKYQEYINGYLDIDIPDSNSDFNMPTKYLIGSANYSTEKTDTNISELILYDSDQSTKRQQIESNINTHYGIY